MNIRCPNCQAVFRVDPARVPPAGIRAKCSRCGHAFRIAGQGEQSAAPAPPPEAAAAPPAPAPAGPARAAAEAGLPAAPAEAAPATVPPQGQQPPPAPPGPVQPAAAPKPTAGPAATPLFGARDPKARAQRIARALVSDIVAYHKPRVEDAGARGTLRTEFREEILKSWEEYVAQVGAELARGTPYFRDALNDILARGQRVF